MLTYVLIGLGVLALLIVIFLVAAAMAAGRLSHRRSTTIAALLRQFSLTSTTCTPGRPGSSFEKIDPAMKRTYEGPRAGVGASQVWSGNSQAGEGRSTITESHLTITSARARVQASDEGYEHRRFHVQTGRQPNGRDVEHVGQQWLHGQKRSAMVMNMDKMLGAKFDKGLASLKQLPRQRETRCFEIVSNGL